MKTARELLLARHGHAAPQLNAITAQAIAGAKGSASRNVTIWGMIRAWLWPSPVAWGAVAAVWLVIIGLETTSNDRSSASSRVASTRPDALEAIRVQKRLYAELLETSPKSPEPFVPKPRSEATPAFCCS